MKKSLIWIIILIIIIVLLVGLFIYKNNNKISCNDSDGGKNYYQFGAIPMNCGTSGQTCGIDSDYCKGDNNTLVEYYCKGDETYTSENFVCPKGCKDGVCLK